jgi:hypothetical protein
MTKSLLLAATLLAGCGSSTDAPGPSPNPPADAAPVDYCAYVPAEVANIVLGGAAREPRNYPSLHQGSCTWRGNDSDVLSVTVYQNGVDRSVFDNDCMYMEAHAVPTTFGAAACATRGNTEVLWDEHETILHASGVGTTEQHLAVLKAVSERLPR